MVPKTVSGDVRLVESSLARPEGAGGPVLFLSCVKPVVQPSQEVVLVSATASLDVWQ